MKQIDSANRYGILLEMVQVLTELDLVISKSYISSDGGWLMDGQYMPHLTQSRHFFLLLFACYNPIPFPFQYFEEV